MVARKPDRFAIVEQKVRRHRARPLVAKGCTADHKRCRDVIPVGKLLAQRRCSRAYDHALDRSLIPEYAFAKPLAALLLVAHDAVFRDVQALTQPKNQLTRQARCAGHLIEKVFGANDLHFDFADRAGTCAATRAAFDNSHLAEMLTRLYPPEDDFRAIHLAEDLDGAGQDSHDTIGGIAFSK